MEKKIFTVLKDTKDSKDASAFVELAAKEHRHFAQLARIAIVFYLKARGVLKGGDKGDH